MILITGASSGIGEACGRYFHSRGREVLLVARRREKLESIQRELGDRCRIANLDVSDGTALTEWVSKNVELLERVNVLINSAGLARGMSSFQESRPADWDSMIDTNLKGLLRFTHALIPFFKKRGEGHIVNLGSVAGRFPYPRGHVYCATKAAVHALNECLRLDINGTGIRVTEISPGMVETEFSEVRLGDPEKARQVYFGMTPLNAQDIAETIAWCVERPRHVNIQEVVIYPTDQASPTLVHRTEQ